MKNQDIENSISLHKTNKFIPSIKNSNSFIPILIILIVLIIGNLFYMQIVKGNEYLFNSKNIYANFEVERAQRGIIYDRNGIKLVENVPRYRVYIRRTNLENPRLIETIKNLEEIFGTEIQPIFDREYERVKNIKNINEIKIFSGVEYNPYIFRIEANPEKFPLLLVEKYMMRNYLFPELTSHIIGYTSEINAEDFATGLYQYGDEIGRYGIERGYNNLLRGQNGINRIDYYGATNQNLKSPVRPKINGKDLHLTIDIRYQQKLYDLIKENSEKRNEFKNTISYGVVVQDVNTGEILAMASYPTFDANLFIEGISQSDYDNYLNNPGKPLSNKAIQYSQSPGSTFKLFTDLVALNENAITKNTIHNANGTFEFGGVTFQDAGRVRYGNINMNRAICVSSNIYHMKAALDLEIKTGGNAANTMNEYFELMRLNQISGLNIGSESIGYFPTPAKKRERGQQWFTGYLLNSAIGQGEVRLSPLALTQMTSVLANRGNVNKPRIIKSQETAVPINLNIPSQHFDAIEEGMKCATELNNTYLAMPADKKVENIAIKTGSAQTGQLINRKEIVHGWEVSYGPTEKPEVAMTVFMENAGGGWKGGYISREFYKWYFENN
jgi:penicillin-binding protein 2